MYYYQFHIGDYMSHTQHLTPMQDLAYRRLLDRIYLTEKPIPSDISQAARVIGLTENRDDVEIVLSDFFILTEFGWVNTRASKELEEVAIKSEKNRAAANKRWGNKKSVNSAPNGEY